MYLPAKKTDIFYKENSSAFLYVPPAPHMRHPHPARNMGGVPSPLPSLPPPLTPGSSPHWSMVEILVHYFCLPPAYPTYLGRRRPCPFLSFLSWPLLPSKESGLGKRREGEERDQLLLRSKEEEEEEGEDDLETAIQPGAFTPPPPPSSSLAAKEGRLLLLLI